MTTPYPLAWPDHIPRSARREKSAFKTSLSKAMENVRTSIRLFGGDSGKPVSAVVISSNAVLGDMRPSDPGVAVWFLWDGEQRCFPCDRYLTVEENLQAIHHIIEARRTEMRHAGIEVVRASFRGFVAALPSPDREPDWTVILGLSRPATAEAVQAAWKARVRAATETEQKRLNIARDAALKEAG